MVLLELMINKCKYQINLLTLNYAKYDDYQECKIIVLNYYVHKIRKWSASTN